MTATTDTLFFDRLDKEWEAAMTGNRYEVLDFNGDVLESSDSWGLATVYLAQWETAESKGAIRDNLTGEIVLDNRVDSD